MTPTQRLCLLPAHSWPPPRAVCPGCLWSGPATPDNPTPTSSQLTVPALPCPPVQSALAAFGVARATNAGQLTVPNVFTSLALLSLPKLYMCDFFVQGVSVVLHSCCIRVGGVAFLTGVAFMLLLCPAPPAQTLHV